MPRNKSGSVNGGVIGKTNKASFGKNTVTNKTSSGDVTLQSGTRVVQALIVAGGGGSSSNGAGGGGAGGVRNLEINATSIVTATVGGGGSGKCVTSQRGCAGTNSTLVACSVTYSATGGGFGGVSTGAGQEKIPGAPSVETTIFIWRWMFSRNR